ncbi:amidohydrolase family protein [Bifidobacterium platyrrhinorum]|nr:amidohydrolase family protein [Bifidobacterium platyrrhinorum]
MRVPLVDGHAHAPYRDAPDARRFAQAMFLIDLPRPGDAGRDGGAGIGDADAGGADADDAALGRLLAGRLGCELTRRFGAALGMADAGGAGGPRRYWRARAASRDLRGFETALLRGCGVSAWVLDTGAAADLMASPREFAARVSASGSNGDGGFAMAPGTPGDSPASGNPVRVVRVVRVESVAERVLRELGDAADAFPGRFRAALDAELAEPDAVGCKSVAAYRTGFAIDWSRPSDERVVAAVRGLDAAGRGRIADPTVESFIVNEALERGLPVQFHVGFGDGEARIRESDPTALEPLATVGAPLVLLHCAPYERQAAWMCATHGNVYMDLSLASMHAGVAGTRALLERVLQWCPFDRLTYASDGFGVAETHALGALVWREAFGALAADWAADGLWDVPYARRVVDAVAHGNAERLYGLG